MAEDGNLFAPGHLQAMLKVIEKFQGRPCTALTTFPHERWTESMSLQVQNTRILSLDVQTPEAIFQNHFSVSVRTAIRKAERCGVRVKSLEAKQIKEAHQLLQVTQLRVGAAYTTDFEFFSAICAAEESLVLCAEHEGRLIAIAIFLLHPNQCTYLFNGWDRSARELNANYALVWQGIRAASEMSHRSFNFGESHTLEIDRSKSKWGAERVPVIRHKF
jgi:lipid II:glycine glycyltransferase (peptidoglycan interpeptide bridge formation enzyme)